MFNIIDRYMKNITKEKINNFALSKDINLSEEELDFTYTFITRNYKDILSNANLFDINRYQNKYSLENFEKIKKVYTEYYSKYHMFIK